QMLKQCRILQQIGWVLILSFGLIQSATAGEINCKDFVSNYVSWAKAKVGVNRVGAKMAAVKIRETNPTKYPWGHGSYSEGGFGLHGNEMEGRFVTVFSDRKAPGGKYRFDPDKADIQDVKLFEDGRVQIMLRTWGNATFFLDSVTCTDDGFINGIQREGNGISMVNFILRKEIIPQGADTSRDWP
ncbi:MAG: hypothetical protein KKD01_15970, partial [Proteobacteria bacterium]|nr:hypothetical protein [Pseudomonadota bacterium]